MAGKDAVLTLRKTGEAPGSADGSCMHTLYYDMMAGGTRAGTCELRPEETWAARLSGQVAYTVFPEHRGHHYALEALRLLCVEAKKRGLEKLTVTCRPGNAASRRILELAGAELETVETVPPEHPLHRSGVREVCVYHIRI